MRGRCHQDSALSQLVRGAIGGNEKATNAKRRTQGSSLMHAWFSKRAPSKAAWNSFKPTPLSGAAAFRRQVQQHHPPSESGTVLSFALGLQEGRLSVHFRIEVEQEPDGRRIAEVVELPGVLAYGPTQDDAVAHVQALALRVVADRLEHDEAGREYLDISFKAA
jgi:predicted RNase H-like HicB family nuclease